MMGRAFNPFKRPFSQALNNDRNKDDEHNHCSDATDNNDVPAPRGDEEAPPDNNYEEHSHRSSSSSSRHIPAVASKSSWTAETDVANNGNEVELLFNEENANTINENSDNKEDEDSVILPESQNDTPVIPSGSKRGKEKKNRNKKEAPILAEAPVKNSTSNRNVYEDDEEEPSKQKAKESSSRSPSWCSCRLRLCLMIITFMIAAGAGTLGYMLFVQKSNSPITGCGDCWCIPDGDNGTCPSGQSPVMDYSEEILQSLESQVPLNAIDLTCNPYVMDAEGLSCSTNPPIDLTSSSAVCGIHFEEVFTNNTLASECQNASYQLKTYADPMDAWSAGAYVTHNGHCGVCSTLQDLSAFIRNQDMVHAARTCTSQAKINSDQGVQCFEKLGFTNACANIFVYRGLNTGEKCLTKCMANLASSNNGPAPTCELNPCLECDEESSGEMFRMFTGRTAQGSNILTSVAQSCSGYPEISFKVCPTTAILTTGSNATRS